MVQKQIKACLFDMDGLLIDSESIYTISFSEILQNKFNRPQGLTWDVKVKLQGLPGVEACQVVLDELDLNDVVTAAEFYKMTSDRQEELWPGVQFLPGALGLINYLSEKGIPIGLCTSSNKSKFEQKTGLLKDGFNKFQAFVFGDNETVKGKGKPLPFIWWVGLDDLNKKLKSEGSIIEDIKIEECLIFEDAVPGLISGKRAGGYVIWVPDANALALMDQKEVKGLLGDQNEFGELLSSLEELDKAKFGL